MSFTHRDRESLAKILGMIGSDHDGEVLSAARKANAMVRAAGLTWQQVLLVRPSAAQSTPPAWKRPGEGDHVALATELLRAGPGILTDWEGDFLRSLLGFKTLKPKQTERLAIIRRKVAASRAAAA